MLECAHAGRSQTQSLASVSKPTEGFTNYNGIVPFSVLVFIIYLQSKLNPESILKGKQL